MFLRLNCVVIADFLQYRQSFRFFMRNRPSGNPLILSTQAIKISSTLRCYSSVSTYTEPKFRPFILSDLYAQQFFIPLGVDS